MQIESHAGVGRDRKRTTPPAKWGLKRFLQPDKACGLLFPTMFLIVHLKHDGVVDLEEKVNWSEERLVVVQVVHPSSVDDVCDGRLRDKGVSIFEEIIPPSVKK